MNRLKKSIFNVEVEKFADGRKLMYNTYYSTFGIMDAKTQEIYEAIESFDNSVVADEETTKTVGIMLREGYITDADVDELAAVKLDRSRFRYQNQTLGITIAPTMDCNMACPYCFEKKNKTIMSEETQDQLVAFVKAHLEFYPTVKQFYVTWYGGEPLMQKEVIYRLSKKLIELCDEKQVEYLAGMITNGALLYKETGIRLAEDCRIQQVSISIDGTKEVHNKRRILINGDDSFDIIMKNIDDCKDILRINVRNNVDKENAADAEKFSDYLIHDKGWTGNPWFYLAFVDDFDETCLTDKSICVHVDQIAEMTDKFKRTVYASNRDVVAAEFFPKRKSLFCGGEGTLSYVVDPEGHIYNCYVQIGVKEHRTGHISKPFAVTTEYAKWLSTDIPEQCEKCAYLPQCMCGCTLYRLNEGDTPQCFSSFYTYKNTLKLAYEDYITQKAQT